MNRLLVITLILASMVFASVGFAVPSGAAASANCRFTSDPANDADSLKAAQENERNIRKQLSALEDETAK
jgi:hypothetical protein